MAQQEEASFSPEEISRYSRQTIIPIIGHQGQLRLKNASVLVIGVGGLGSPAALYLAAAGVGRIGIMDGDKVELTNLHRQILYSTSQMGKAKAESAAQTLRALNSEIQIEVFSERLTMQNAIGLFSQFDLILDGADNFATRFLANDAAYFTKKALISASVLGFEGQLSVFTPGGSCYRCLYPEPPPAGSVPSCAEAGVLGVMPGLLGILQATEALKILLKIGEPLYSQLLLYQSLDMEFTKMTLQRNPDCPLCGPKARIKTLSEENFVCSTDAKIPEISPKELKEWLGQKQIQLLDVREPSEFAEGKLPFTHHIPIAEIEKKYTDLSQETPVVVYCRSGGRSRKACEFLRTKGLNAINMTGGIQAWNGSFK